MLQTHTVVIFPEGRRNSGSLSNIWKKTEASTESIDAFTGVALIVRK